MPHEDLYDDIRREEEETEYRYRTGISKKAEPRKPVNEAEARARYERDIRPVIDRVKRAEAGLPLTDNPLKNFMLRVLHRDKLPDPVVVVNPNEGIAVPVGQTTEEVRQEIISNPDKFADLRKKAAEVKPVGAVRKTWRDLLK